MTPIVSGIHHVQLAAPTGGEAVARRFFGEILGMRELPKPTNLVARGGVWFACGMQELHIGIEAGSRPSRKAHPAFLVPDVRALRAHLERHGVATRDGEPLAGYDRFYCDDPFGNRLEFLSPAADGDPGTEV